MAVATGRTALTAVIPAWGKLTRGIQPGAKAGSDI